MMYLSRRCDFVIEVPREVEILCFGKLHSFTQPPLRLRRHRNKVVPEREQKCSWLGDDQGTVVVIKEKNKSLPNQLSAVSTSQANLPRTLIICSLFLHQENTESLKKTIVQKPG